MEPVLNLDAEAWRVAVIVGTFLAAAHAYRKLTPFFAITWFGSGLVFGWFWTSEHAAPEAILLPAFLIYLAAALTKGLVEHGRFAGNHVVHVLVTGLMTAVVAVPVESAGAAMGWILPRGAPHLAGVPSESGWLGGVKLDEPVQWCLIGMLFYGYYKLLDHIGLGGATQTVLLFGGMPFLIQIAEWLLSQLG
jgi:hypothetical protein